MSCLQVQVSHPLDLSKKYIVSKKRYEHILPCENCKQEIETCNKTCIFEKFIKFTIFNIKTPQVLSFMDCMVFFFYKILPKYGLVEEVIKNYNVRLHGIDETKIKKSYRYLKAKGFI